MYVLLFFQLCRLHYILMNSLSMSRASLSLLYLISLTRLGLIWMEINIVNGTKISISEVSVFKILLIILTLLYRNKIEVWIFNVLTSSSLLLRAFRKSYSRNSARCCNGVMRFICYCTKLSPFYLKGSTPISNSGYQFLPLCQN